MTEGRFRFPGRPPSTTRVVLVYRPSVIRLLRALIANGLGIARFGRKGEVTRPGTRPRRCFRHLMGGTCDEL